jgi:acyl carrier protein
MTLTIDEITRKVRTIIGYYGLCRTETVGLDKTMDDLGFDSLEHVQIIMAIEEELRIEIPDDDMVGHKTTVAQIIDYVAKRVGAS